MSEARIPPKILRVCTGEETVELESFVVIRPGTIVDATGKEISIGARTVIQTKNCIPGSGDGEYYLCGMEGTVLANLGIPREEFRQLLKAARK